MASVKGRMFGSITPRMLTDTNVWFGGQSSETVGCGGEEAGGWFLTVTVKPAVAVLLCASVAQQFTVVMPTGKVDPDAGEHVSAMLPSTESENAVTNVTMAPSFDEANATTSGSGGRAGGVVSRTVTMKVCVDLFPCWSRAVHPTGVESSGKSPEARSQDTD